jgi:hypothetical protein
MRSLNKSSFIQSFMSGVSILFLAVILHSCDDDLVNKFLPKPATAAAFDITRTGATLQGSVYLGGGNLPTAKFENGTNMS